MHVIGCQSDTFLHMKHARLSEKESKILQKP